MRLLPPKFGHNWANGGKFMGQDRNWLKNLTLGWKRFDTCRRPLTLWWSSHTFKLESLYAQSSFQVKLKLEHLAQSYSLQTKLLLKIEKRVGVAYDVNKKNAQDCQSGTHQILELHTRNYNFQRKHYIYTQSFYLKMTGLVFYIVLFTLVTQFDLLWSWMTFN